MAASKSAFAKRPVVLIGAALALVLASGVAMLLINFMLSFIFAMPPSPSDWNEWRRARSDALNEGSDWRRTEEVLAECRQSGCRPYINPAELRRSPDGVWPVTARPDSTLVYCNESGVWKFIDTDRYGFNGNKDALFEQSDVVLVGDSFGTGACVDERYSIAGILRARGVNVLNLSVGGHQPLDELAVLKEYLPRSAVLIWLYYEGNDHYPAVNDAFLRSYLLPGFTQKLKTETAGINAVFDALEADAWRKIEQHQPPQPLGARSGIVDWAQGIFRPTMSLTRAFGESEFEFDGDSLRSILDEARRAAADRGAARFMFVYLPAWERFSWRPRWHAEVRKYESVRRKVAPVATSAGFEFIDVAKVFDETPSPHLLFPYESRAHYNQRGYLLATNAIHDALSGRRVQSERR